MPKEITSIDEIAAACTDCGNCLHACPVYNAEWVEPNSPRGKVNIIKALRDGRLEPNALNKQFVYKCLLCGSCQYICTKGVQFTDMMLEQRDNLAGGRKIPFFKKLVLYFYQSVLFKKFVWVVDLLVKTPLRNRFLIPRRRRASLRSILSKGDARNPEEYDILLFPGCVMTRFYPEITRNIYEYLTEKGFSVVVPSGLECCGFPYISQGWTRKFRKLREKNLEVFSRFRFKRLLVPCGTGVKTFLSRYDLEGVEVYELTEFFHKFIPAAEVRADFKEAGAEPGARITWHDPCHHLKTLGIEDAPRSFMKQLGESFVDDKNALCCGFGGIFSVGFPSTSKKILKRKEESLREMGAGTVVTACPGCFLQLRESLPQRVLFFIDLFRREEHEEHEE
jgi:glycolate oxidase iron-sulfur subunit